MLPVHALVRNQANAEVEAVLSATICNALNDRTRVGAAQITHMDLPRGSVCTRIQVAALKLDRIQEVHRTIVRTFPHLGLRVFGWNTAGLIVCEWSMRNALAANAVAWAAPITRNVLTQNGHTETEAPPVDGKEGDHTGVDEVKDAAAATVAPTVPQRRTHPERQIFHARRKALERGSAAGATGGTSGPPAILASLAASLLGGFRSVTHRVSALVRPSVPVASPPADTQPTENPTAAMAVAASPQPQQQSSATPKGHAPTSKRKADAPEPSARTQTRRHVPERWARILDDANVLPRQREFVRDTGKLLHRVFSDIVRIQQLDASASGLDDGSVPAADQWFEVRVGIAAHGGPSGCVPGTPATCTCFDLVCTVEGITVTVPIADLNELGQRVELTWANEGAVSCELRVGGIAVRIIPVSCCVHRPSLPRA